MRSSLIDLFVLVGFSIGANAGITFTACNTAATDTLNQAIKDAAAMAKSLCRVPLLCYCLLKGFPQMPSMDSMTNP